MINNRRVVAASLAAVIAFSGCSSDGDGGGADRGGIDSSEVAADAAAATATDAGGSASGDVPGACTLITADEVAAVLGDHNTDDAGFTAQAIDNGPELSCTYEWSSQRARGEFSVNVFPESRYFEDPGGPDPRPIAGIGDDAFEVSGNFYARVGDLMVHIVNVQAGAGTDEEFLQIAASRLPR